MEREKGKLSTTRTIHVSIDTDKCVAYWECVNTCLEQFIGKVKILWHKHLVFRKPENFSGYKKCMNTCPHNVFSKHE